MLNECPSCNSDVLGDQWVGPGRRLQQYCHNCGWRGEKRVPEQKEVKTSKKVSVGQFYGFSFELYDRYGHALVYSCTYNTEKDAEDALKRELEYHRNREEWPCKGVIYPATVIVHGKVYE